MSTTARPSCHGRKVPAMPSAITPVGMDFKIPPEQAFGVLRDRFEEALIAENDFPANTPALAAAWKEVEKAAETMVKMARLKRLELVANEAGVVGG